MKIGKCLKRIVITFVALIALALPIKATAEDSHLTYDELKRHEEQKADQEWSNQLIAYSQTLVGKRTGQCVLAVRQYFGVPKSEVQGMAKNTQTNTKEAKVGSVIVLNMSKVGHVGIVIAVDGELVTYFDSNGNWNQRGAIRTIFKSDKRIKGYRIINYRV